MPEQKFQEFKNSVKPEEFRSIAFLEQKAKELETSDPILSERILLRVRNLKKQNAETNNSVATNKSSTTKADAPSNKATKKPTYIDKLKRSPFVLLVLLPTLIFSFYQIFIATERFESQSQVIVQQPDGMATMDAGLALLSGMGVPTSGSDSEIVKAFVYSTDMLEYLDQHLNLRQHYSNEDIDLFSRLQSDASNEEFREFYQNHVTVYVDDRSGVINIFAQGFEAEYSQQLTSTIVDRAEWYINSIGHQLAEAQLEFIQGEHALVEKKLEESQKSLLTFQQTYNLLDPLAEGAAMQQIAYTLEGEISAKETELKGLQAIMTNEAPQVIAAKNQLNALKEQLESERGKLSTETGENIPVSEILARYTDLKINMDLALQAYTSSQVSLEKSRIEAYRQLKYLVVLENATKPQDSKYPDVIYNVTLFAILLSMTFAIARIVLLTIRELK